MGHRSTTTTLLERQVAEWTYAQRTAVEWQADWFTLQRRIVKYEGALWLTWFWLLVAAAIAFEWIIWLAHPATFNPLGALFSSLFVAVVVAGALDLVTVLRLTTIFSRIIRATLRTSAVFRVTLFRRSAQCAFCAHPIVGPFAHCAPSRRDFLRAVRAEEGQPDGDEFPLTLRGDYHPRCLCERAQAGMGAAAAAASHRLLLTREALATHQWLDAQLAAAVESDAVDAREDAGV